MKESCIIDLTGKKIKINTHNFGDDDDDEEEEIKQNAKKNNLVPVVVKGTTIIRLSAMDKNKGDVDRFEGIDWKRFFEILKQNKLMVV